MRTASGRQAAITCRLGRICLAASRCGVFCECVTMRILSHGRGSMRVTGTVQKMAVTLAEPVQYRLRLDDAEIELNPFIGQHIRLHYQGEIHCLACGRKTRKSYCQGHCFPCSQRLAACDICIVRPEKCHYDQGTCREPEWARDHCLQEHVLYLANTSAIKVGITRRSQIPTRWIDQGATQALPVLKAASRHQVGLLELAFKAEMADRTDWRAMLRGEPPALDLQADRDSMLERVGAGVDELRHRFGEAQITILPLQPVVEINYPVLRYPEKIKALNFDKTPLIEGRLEGIKGQYLLLDCGVINLRKFGGYQVEFTL